jgi:hypothetical protein
MINALLHGIDGSVLESELDAEGSVCVQLVHRALAE